MTKKKTHTHEMKAIEFMLKIQRKLTNSRSQDSTSRIS
jgi:hypothetical protein